MSAVLPREVAAGIITGAISRIAWIVGAIGLLTSVPILISVYLDHHQGHLLPLPLTLLLFQFTALSLAAWANRAWVVVTYLVLGGAAVVGFQLEVITTISGALDDYVFLLNRPAIALELIGVVAGSTLVGASWILIGFGAALATFAITSVIADVEFTPGFGPFFVAAIALVGYATLGVIQWQLRRRLPNYDALERETLLLERGADLSRKSTAVVHDTLLNDLTIVMNGAEQLDEAARQRLRDDLDTLTSAEWLRTATAVVPKDDADAELRNQFMRVISEFQWRGLSVEITGSGSGIYRLEPEVSAALIDAARAGLENVLRHSGVTTAEIDLSYTDTEMTVMITDEGVGFDRRSVANDRLGLKGSIVGRIEDAGGHVQVWSTPGEGTAIVISLPVAEVLAHHEPSQHKRHEQRGFTQTLLPRISAQQIDPLSWFTGPYVPLVFGLVGVAYAVAAILLGGDATGLWWVQVIAVSLFCVAQLVVHVWSTSLRRAFTPLVGAIALGISGLGYVVSAVGYSTFPVHIELWWAPVAFALTMGSLAPYLSGRWLLRLTVAGVLVTTPIVVPLIAPEVTDWGIIAIIAIVAYAPLIGAAVAVGFSALVVSRTTRLLERRSQTVVRESRTDGAGLERAERGRLAQLTSRAVPFLEDVIRSGTITASDRALAAQIARRLRDDLVAVTERTWLEELVGSAGVVVLDPERRADKLRAGQRTALRSFVGALLEEPSIDHESLLIELRGRPDGATAVGVSLDVDLPEGRRIMHLRPHYLHLKMSSQDLTWDRSALRLSFEFPSAQR